ncbi:MAG: tyrosine-type recombinase/integrase [Eubacteriaceae bacterium]|nr:tyrosine-type recombinase/integrase [Eubacteriaceae bacterium]
MLNSEWQSAIAFYESAAKLKGKKQSAIDIDSRCAASFFLALQQNGAESFKSITDKGVAAAFIGDGGQPRYGHCYKRAVETVLKECAALGAEAFSTMALFLPQIQKERKNIQYLTPEESEKYLQALNSGEVSLRDRAIGTLAYYTGLRSSDIAGLKLSSIDWGNGRISLVQQKTGIQLDMPLTAVVGNAIFEYISTERPKTGCEFVFVSKQAPYGGLSRSGISWASNGRMKRANIRQSAGSRKGIHIFRHRMAVGLLENEIPQPVISKLLGHTAPSSIEPCLSADFGHLKECALSIERFPVPEGLFGDE